MELACEEHFKQHVSRTQEGRYMVALPFNEKKELLGHSRQQAISRLKTLERRFKSNPSLQQEYTKVINEYKDLGHMILSNDESEDGFYLPHHAVVKETSLTTKVRVVFDGSAKTRTKISLNDALMVGPTIQDDLFTLILRFRLHTYVLTGDIEKMYRQVLMRPEDTKYQKILWREKGKIQTYELQTVTFGLASSPYLAVRCLHQLADDEEQHYPLAARTLRKDLYMDDWFTGVKTIEEGLKLRDEMIHLLATGGFILRQCASNSTDLLEGLADCTINEKLLGGEDPTLKALGVRWNSKEDTITYTVNPLATREIITMRTIASDIARIFDPLGLLNPVIAQAKIIQQGLWRLNLDWDDPTPNEIQTQWKEFSSQLPSLNELSFERKIVIDDSIKIELHGFCDASEKAYGAYIYLRSTNTEGTIQVRLFCAKSRITPLKGNHTIPRLELCAAELLSNLYSKVLKSTDIEFNEEYFWSDSTVVLYWIKTPPHQLQRFVGNRVAKIQERTEPESWRHVRTHDNPADALSRGQSAQEFLSNKLWRQGPDWLSTEPENWPQLKIEKPSTLPELKRVTCLKIAIMNNTFLQRYSSFEKLQRITALCLRWKRKKKETQWEKYITVEELEAAETRIIQLLQQQCFANELQTLRTEKPLSPLSGLINLSPFLDDKGLLCVGGRLKNSKELPQDSKYPMLLPKGHHVTELLIKQVHGENLHAGIQTTLHLLRQRYWLPDGCNQIRHYIRKCIICTKVNPPPVNYKMSHLPKERITQSRPFTHTGVDYCGPFFIKEKKLRNRNKIKVWICIFVCFTTKAVHIEVVSDLTSEEFLATLGRFVCRHPACQVLHSDNATTFTGANNELKELYQFLRTKETEDTVQRNLAKKGIQWRFIPAQSPHCGGLWEAAVKSCKHHLRRIISDELLTYEQLNTLCIKIEGILNSRPLTPLSSDPNDLTALTPAHFLHGEITKDLAAPDWSDTPANRLSQWQHLEKMKQHFWNRWHKEYLNELNIRKKWTTGEHQITIGSLVLLRDDNLPPMKWRTGRVIEVFPSDDGIIRKVKLKTTTGTFERNVKRLAPLPIDNSQATSD